MDTNNEKTIAELGQELSDAILDCLIKTNGDGVCYIDKTINIQYYLQILLAICEKKQIQLDERTIKDCFGKANKVAAERYQLFEKEKIVTDILEEFINSCSWTPFNFDDAVTIPYVMNHSETKKRENELKDTWETFEGKIKKYEREFRDEFKPSDFNFQDYKNPVNGSTRHGKGSPDMIRYVIDKLIEDKVIASDSNKVVQFMKDYAIGIDCSGFVTRAVATVLEELQVEKNNQIMTIGSTDGKVLLPDCSLMASKEFINSNKIETSKTTQNYKIKDNVLSKVRVGDIICTTEPYYHVKIIYKIDRDDNGLATKLYYAESTSVGQQGIKKSENMGLMKGYTIVRPYYMDIYYHGQYGTHLNKQ